MKSSIVIMSLLLTALITGCETRVISTRSAPVSAVATFTIPYVESSQVSVMPKAVKRAQPIYPKELRKAGVEGYAVTEFIVDAQGVPQQVQCVEASDRAFAVATEQAMSQWRYRPALKDGQAVAVRTLQRMDFSVRE